jgi:hypothetical protein
MSVPFPAFHQKILIDTRRMRCYKGEAKTMPRDKQMEAAIEEKVRMTDSIVSKLKISRENQAIAFRVVLEFLLHQEAPLAQARSVKQPAGKAQSREALTDRIATLCSEGFFKEPKTANEVQDELKNRGAYHSFAAVGMALLALVRNKTIRRVPVEKGGKKQYLYTNP